ncbi:MAG: rhomboid family intramembrane serine protease [Saprospiraceae bacterium]|nr:rhomboid family intramembrane serine protease [Saprospiraceae bacterium]MBP7679517.1 rhomboid family intramembrane serine protease [Saprospiraceae bacterium]
MNQVTDVVKNLIILNVLVFILCLAMPSLKYQLAIFYPTSPYFQPYQILTHMFNHANFGHILFNMLGLYMFGSPVERVLGSQRFLMFYLFCGFGAIALHMGVNYVELNYMGALPEVVLNTPTLGASGAVYGLLAAVAYFYPNAEMMSLFLPIPVKAKYAVVIYICIELFMGVGRLQGGVAHFAHIGGALFGYLLLLYWARKRYI